MTTGTNYEAQPVLSCELKSVKKEFETEFAERRDLCFASNSPEHSPPGRSIQICRPGFADQIQ